MASDRAARYWKQLINRAGKWVGRFSNKENTWPHISKFFSMVPQTETGTDDAMEFILLKCKHCALTKKHIKQQAGTFFNLRSRINRIHLTLLEHFNLVVIVRNEMDCNKVFCQYFCNYWSNPFETFKIVT